MDQRRFDALARTAAAPRTRRGFLGAVAALGAGLLAARDAGAQQPPAVITQAYCGSVRCKNNPSKCREGCVCCVYSNGNSRCVPPGQCGGGGVVVGGTNPNQGTCPTGANVCETGVPTTCNGAENCLCVRTTAGATVCATVGDGVIGCSTDAECSELYGTPAFCISTAGGGCGAALTACLPPCSATPA